MTTIPCPACAGDGRIPDKTGGGHHGRCPECLGTGVEIVVNNVMKPVPADLISFARIPKRERICDDDVPQYRLYIRGVPGGLGAGYTDILVVRISEGWYLIDRRRGGGVVHHWDERGFSPCVYHKTRAAAAAEMHLAPDFIPENVREYLAAVTP
jgi:hypothetical protein